MSAPHVEDLYRQAREPVICTGCGNEWADHLDEIREARRMGWEVHHYSPSPNVNSKQLLELLEWLTSNDLHIDSDSRNDQTLTFVAHNHTSANGNYECVYCNRNLNQHNDSYLDSEK